eukprot:CAMPEP_0116852052 /NCGR_PEP_ID=MMETSP0418-20121206/17078_1 /TAXON_ID=1158023 /ORGANISM="Astrosyne radiata, Strain 13vi08-1A" /LENGTH=290 /DNA_ID=CAMNT_0004484171 /DNA_START=275 /DNA_END=1147 /DNA_ORIENTATION=-
MDAPMVVRMVNDITNDGGPQQFNVATSAERGVGEEDVPPLQSVMMNTSPQGNNSLTHHMRQIANSLLALPEELQQTKAVAMVLVTDHLPRDRQGREGEPVNREFVEILKMLDGMSVWVVIRLSTDEQRVVDFFNDLDNRMAYVSVEDDAAAAGGGGVHLDVLDDYVSEAEEVQKHNPWLNYAYPLHLCRESAVNFPVFDALNDRPLHHEEVGDFMSLLFDRQSQGAVWNDQPLPNPKSDYKAFRREVQLLVNRNPGLWNPIKKRIVPWIDLGQMDRLYGGAGGASCCTLL